MQKALEADYITFPSATRTGHLSAYDRCSSRSVALQSLDVPTKLSLGAMQKPLTHA